MRNETLHAMFVYDEKGKDIVETQAMRIDERRGDVSYGKSRPMDRDRIASIDREVEHLTEWNRIMWIHLASVSNFVSGNASMGGNEPTDIMGESNDVSS
ncbi:hypothetical protein SAMN06297251_1164 [Fulvimarina manganoxydans]|uniref:Uncharacterized protein n=2 Tax=Fulvimarina manganoxydans TaxID=937218 RepID=A0A1W2DLL0_9HYPH|nr:hypothetical protein SAMN06297251_1164 [Fulvimarina manganoxydans]